MSKHDPIVIPRDVLLVEIERRCSFTDCDGRVPVALTKAEANAYLGFECHHCTRWNDDRLTPKDIPDWWDELSILKQAN
jgi:hypothetical protein